MTSSRTDQVSAFVGWLNAKDAALVRQIEAAIDKGADDFVDLARAACPTDPTLEDHPGQLRESIHKVDGSDPLQKRVVADARDAKGEYYGVHVEVGHRTPHGGHVPAHPFFYPAWRLVKREIKARIGSAVKVVVEER